MIGQLALAGGAFVWAGMLGGISFLEAPLKFRAPGITLELGLGIGRLVFTALNRVELVLAAIVIVGGVLTRPSAAGVAALAVAVVLLSTQTLWLRPALNQRTARVIAGEPVPPSRLHATFIALEVVKLVAVVVVGVLAVAGG